VGNEEPVSTSIDSFFQLLSKIYTYLAYQYCTGSTQKMSFFPISLLHKFKIQQINHPRNNNAVTAVKEVRKPLYGVLPEHKLKVNGNSRQTSQTSSCCCLFVKPVVFPDSQEDEGIYRHSA